MVLGRLQPLPINIGGTRVFSSQIASRLVPNLTVGEHITTIYYSIDFIVFFTWIWLTKFACN